MRTARASQVLFDYTPSAQLGGAGRIAAAWRDLNLSYLSLPRRPLNYDSFSVAVDGRDYPASAGGAAGGGASTCGGGMGPKAGSAGVPASRAGKGTRAGQPRRCGAWLDGLLRQSAGELRARQAGLARVRPWMLYSSEERRGGGGRGRGGGGGPESPEAERRPADPFFAFVGEVVGWELASARLKL